MITPVSSSSKEVSAPVAVAPAIAGIPVEVWEKALFPYLTLVDLIKLRRTAKPFRDFLTWRVTFQHGCPLLYRPALAVLPNTLPEYLTPASMWQRLLQLAHTSRIPVSGDGFRTPFGPIKKLKVLSDDRIASIHEGGNVSVLPAPPGGLCRDFIFPNMMFLEALPDGKMIAIERRGDCFVILPKGITHLFSMKLAKDLLATSAALLSDGRIVVGTSDERLFVYSGQGEHLQTWGAANAKTKYSLVYLLAFSDKLLTISSSGATRIWNVQNGKSEEPWKISHKPLSCEPIALPGQRFVSGHTDGTIRVWDIQNRSKPTVFKQNGSISNLVALPDEQVFALGGDKAAKKGWVWDVDTGVGRLGDGSLIMGVRKDGSKVRVITPTSDYIYIAKIDQSLLLEALGPEVTKKESKTKTSVEK